MDNVLFLPSDVLLCADECLDTQMHQKLFEGFAYGKCRVRFEKGAKGMLSFGTCEPPLLSQDAEYALSITKDGFCVRGRDSATLARGFCALLQRIEWESGTGRIYLAPHFAQGVFKTGVRMLHLCVFPETTHLQLSRYIRLAGMLQYTHIVLEFWGMLRYDCCAALAWPQAFSKKEAGELIAQIRALGMQAIPMFNHLGHATACRVNTGKHVVLDQDPSKFALFTPDGWSWDVKNPEAVALLRKVRAELYELFGDGEYFHLGLDESYMYTQSAELYGILPDYLGELTAEVEREGRRPLLWMDMFLPPEAFGGQKAHVCAQKTPEECDAVLGRLHPASVLVDWQYDMTEAPIPTSLYLKGKGFDLIGAPWLEVANGKAHIDTVVQNGLFGVMQTTWHTMHREAFKMLPFARALGAAKAPWSDVSNPKEETAALLRKVTWEPYGYAEAGWRTAQITLGSEKEC